MLTGTEASGANYLSEDELASCDGFVIIGDAFSSNPVCSRAVLDRRRAEPRTPVVAIDPGYGVSTKFATHVVTCGPGMEYAALCSLCTSAGVSVDTADPQDGADMPTAAAAGQAVADCKKLGVIIAAEYGRTAPWRQIGYLAGKLAEAKGGGVAAQTVGANALAALRLARKTGAVSLAEALCDRDAFRLALGCDVLAMLGWSASPADCTIDAAATALPNCTSQQAATVLPMALGCELPGTVFVDCVNPVGTSPLLAPPAGAVSPSELIAALAMRAGVARPDVRDATGLPERIGDGRPASVAQKADSPVPTLLLARQASSHGCGDLTGHGSWQHGMTEAAEIRVSTECAEELGLRNLSLVSIAAGDRSITGRIRISPELPGNTAVLPEGTPEARALVPCEIDRDSRDIVSRGSSFEAKWLR
jgi:hypothetical protein